MTEKRLFVMAHEMARQNAIECVRNAPAGHVVTVSPPKRNLEQNACLWARLTEIAEQLPWHGRMMSPEEWKHLFTASLKQQTVVPNLEGSGFVAMGHATSSMTKTEMSDLLELISAFAAQHGVAFNE